MCSFFYINNAPSSDVDKRQIIIDGNFLLQNYKTLYIDIVELSYKKGNDAHCLPIVGKNIITVKFHPCHFKVFILHTPVDTNQLQVTVYDQIIVVTIIITERVI